MEGYNVIVHVNLHHRAVFLFVYFLFSGGKKKEKEKGGGGLTSVIHPSPLITPPSQPVLPFLYISVTLYVSFAYIFLGSPPRHAVMLKPKSEWEEANR